MTTQQISDDVHCFPELEINIDEPAELYAKSKQLVAKLRPDWDPSGLRKKVFSDGITNVLVGVYHEGGSMEDMVLVRVYGHNTGKLIDRQAEIENMKLFHKSGCGSKLYATFKNGLAYSFIPGIIPTPELMLDPKVNQLIVREFSKMHRMKTGGQPCLWDLLKKVLGLYVGTAKGGEQVPAKEQLSQEIGELEQALKDCGSPVVFAHNDLLLGNIVYDESSAKVTFIDFEYGGMNYQAYDIANHFCEFVGVIGELDYENVYPKEDFQKEWIARYLREFHGGREVESEEVHKTYVLVNKFSLCAHLVWGIWGLVQAENSTLDFDFDNFARQRLNEYKRRKSQFLALQ